MTVEVINEQEVVYEAADILFRQLSPAKVVRLLVAWQIGRGDYLTIREQLFGDETVNSLFEKIQVYQNEKEARSGD